MFTRVLAVFHKSLTTDCEIKSYDYGAFATLSVSVKKKTGEGNGDGGYSPVGRAESRIPLDSDNDKIADGWERKYASNIETFTPDLDAEEGPEGNKYPGDGLSVFEEYRGFKLDSEKQSRGGHKAGHIRTNPKSDKDLFIAYAPLGNIINLPSKVRVIGLNEMYGPGGKGSNNRIDFNDAGIPCGQQTQQRALVPLMDQKAIHPGGVLGRTYNENPPHKVEKIYYFTRAIEQFVRQNLGNENFAPNVLNLTAITIAHEIGHGVNLSHHKPRLAKDGERNCIMNVSPVVLNNALASVNKYYFNEIHSTDTSDLDDIDPNHVEDFRLK